MDHAARNGHLIKRDIYIYMCNFITGIAFPSTSIRDGSVWIEIFGLALFSQKYFH